MTQQSIQRPTIRPRSIWLWTGIALVMVVAAAAALPVAPPQSAPRLLGPVDGSEFVSSDLWLEWEWAPGLAQNQFFALRLWAEDRPAHESWTREDTVSAKEIIDTFGIGIGEFSWQVAVVNIDTDGLFAKMGSDWSAVFKLQRLRRPRIAAKAFAEMSPAAQYFHDLNLDPSTLIDAVHRFVHDNSENDEQLQYSADYGDAVDLMLNYSQGKASERPQLLCDGRSTAMLTVLGELGIESRLVFLYKSDPGWLSQHTVLEVFNPLTQHWQVHDLAWDFYFAHASADNRISAARILFGAHQDLVGCPIAGGACSPELMQESFSYFGALRYGYTMEILANPDRFDLSARFEGQDNMNLAEFIGDGYPQRVTIRLDTWDRD